MGLIFSSHDAIDRSMQFGGNVMMRRLGDPSTAFADMLRSRPRALHAIENELAKSDPQLTALFATFTLLTRDEELPRTARLDAGGARLPSGAWRAWLWSSLLLALAAIIRAAALVGACLRGWIAGLRRAPAEQDSADQGSADQGSADRHSRGKPSKGAWPWI
jgi:hypothetical protein